MTHDELDALLLAAEEDNKRGGFANAEQLAREAIQQLAEDKSSASEALRIRALLALSDSLWRRGLSKDALPVAEEALTRSLAATGPQIRAFEATALRNIGNVYCYLSQYAKALEYYEKALAVDEELGNKAGVARQTGNIGAVYRSLSQYAKALEYFEKALAIFEKLGDKRGVAVSIGNIGSVYAELSQYAKALEYHEKALAINEELGNKAGVANRTGNIGNVYFDLSQYAKALEYHERAHKLAEDIGDRRQVGYWLVGIGASLRKMGGNKEVMEHLQHSLHVMREEIETDETVAATLINIGSLLAEEDQPGEAIEKLEEGLALAEKLGEKQYASEAHKELADVYEKNGDIAKSHDHLKQYLALDKEIFSDDTRKRVEAFNFRVAIAEKEQEKEVQRLKAEHYERELANSTLQLVAQTELLSELRDGLMGIVRKFPMPDGAAKELRERLKTLPCKAVDWEKFDTQFKAAHPEFTKKLLDKHPELSPTELRICSLVRMNLKSEDIARLLCLSERTVENHRNHIRQKMKLKRSEELAIVLARM